MEHSTMAGSGDPSIAQMYPNAQSIYSPLQSTSGPDRASFGLYSNYPSPRNSSIFSANGSGSSQITSTTSLRSSIESSHDSLPCRPSFCSSENTSSLRKAILTRNKSNQNQFFCPLCLVVKEEPTPTFKRKGELKTHLERHFTECAVYYCDHCPTARDRYEDLKSHCKKAHGRAFRSKAVVSRIVHLLPQQLFACGFFDWTGKSHCRDVRTSWQLWLDHIAEHMERGDTTKEWRYTHVMKNMLRQPEISSYWKDYLYLSESPDKRLWTPLNWDIDESRALMLKLNRRDFRPGINSLIAWAYALGLPENRKDDKNEVLRPEGTPGTSATDRGLELPTRDSIPIRPEVSADEVDRILMRCSSPYPQRSAPQRRSPQKPPNLDLSAAIPPMAPWPNSPDSLSMQPLIESPGFNIDQRQFPSFSSHAHFLTPGDYQNGFNPNTTGFSTLPDSHCGHPAPVDVSIPDAPIFDPHAENLDVDYILNTPSDETMT